MKLKFQIDNHGITICKSHSSYKDIPDFDEENHISDNKSYDPSFVRYIPGLYAWCETCEHYKNDTCYFSRQEINHIKHELGMAFGTLLFNKFRCEVCNFKIRSYFNIMRKIYLEQEENNIIPLLCSGCNHGIKYDNLNKTIRTYIFLNILYLMPITIGPLAFLLVVFYTSTDPSLNVFAIITTLIFFAFAFIFIRKSWKLAGYKRIFKNYSKETLLM